MNKSVRDNLIIAEKLSATAWQPAYGAIIVATEPKAGWLARRTMVCLSILW
ncbi:MAG: hypothetical protein U0487_00655 [Patescibacteria group bacterium]